MKRVIYMGLYLVASIFLVSIHAARAQQALTGYEIMERVDNRTFPIDMTTKMTMNLIDKRGKVRKRIIKTYRMSDDKQIMWFLHPPDVKGSSFLRLSYDDRDDDMWLYLPAFGKVRRIASHAKKGSFMGSDFTFEDMGDRKLKDYAYRLLKEEKIDGQSCWVVESIPNKGVITDYSKIVSWIWRDDDVAIREEFYDKRKNLKKIKAVDLTKVERYWVPKLLTMENLKSRHKTELIFDEINVDTGLDAKVFKSDYLTRIH